MSQINFFLLPNVIFDLIRQSNIDKRSQLIFRRFQSEGFDARIQQVDLNADHVDEIYSSGKFSEYCLSLGSVPYTFDDWKFMERAANELLVFEGSRVVGRDLEITKLRVFSKKSDAVSNYKQITKSIKERCGKKGLNTLSGHSVPDVWYDSAIENRYRLRLSFASDDEKFICTSNSDTLKNPD